MNIEKENIYKLLFADKETRKVGIQIMKGMPELESNIRLDFLYLYEFVIKDSNQKHREKIFLKLKNNKTRAWNTIIDNLPRVKALLLNQKEIKQLPNLLFALTKLEELEIKGSCLSYLPDRIGKLSNLKKLNLYYNEIKELPIYFKQLSNLRELNLGFNLLQEFPKTLLSLNQLRQINLKGNPIEIGDITKAKALLPDCEIIF